MSLGKPHLQLRAAHLVYFTPTNNACLTHHCGFRDPGGQLIGLSESFWVPKSLDFWTQSSTLALWDIVGREVHMYTRPTVRATSAKAASQGK